MPPRGDLDGDGPGPRPHPHTAQSPPEHVSLPRGWTSHVSLSRACWTGRVPLPRTGRRRQSGPVRRSPGLGGQAVSGKDDLEPGERGLVHSGVSEKKLKLAAILRTMSPRAYTLVVRRYRRLNV